MTTATRERVLSTEITGNVVTFKHGDKVVASVDVSKLDKVHQLQAMLHGVKQKVSDAAAASKGVELSTRIANLTATAERIQANGGWNAVRSTVDKTAERITELSQAVLLHKGKTLEFIRDTANSEILAKSRSWVESLSEAQKLGLEVSLAEQLAKIRSSAVAAESVDTLLDGMDFGLEVEDEAEAEVEKPAKAKK